MWRLIGRDVPYFLYKMIKIMQFKSIKYIWIVESEVIVFIGNSRVFFIIGNSCNLETLLILHSVSQGDMWNSRGDVIYSRDMNSRGKSNLFLGEVIVALF